MSALYNEDCAFGTKSITFHRGQQKLGDYISEEINMSNTTDTGWVGWAIVQIPQEKSAWPRSGDIAEFKLGLDAVQIPVNAAFFRLSQKTYHRLLVFLNSEPTDIATQIYLK